MGFNQQLWDLGMSQKELDNPADVTAKIQALDRDFSLVLIAEWIEESLVLLADLICVPLYVVASLKVNARKKSKKVINVFLPARP